MSLKDDLIRIANNVSAVLDGCNSQLVSAAASLGELPPKIEQTLAATYDTAFSAGEEAGRAEGEVIGRGIALDEFWEHMQNGGNKTDYTACFGAWTDDENFKPRYDLVPSQARYMFAHSKITDLAALLQSQGVVLDFSGNSENNALAYLFWESKITKAPIIDLSEQGNNNYNFYNATYLQSIEKIILSPTGNNYNFTTTFEGCTSLVDVTFENFFKQSSVNLRWCPLSRASIESVVAALGDTATGKTLTLKQSAVNAAFTNEEWETLVVSKPNWTITLAA